MATRAAVAVTGAVPNVHAQTIKWTGLLNGDVGAAIDMRGQQDRCVQVVGTFGTGGSISFEGSNDGGTTWNVLTDTLGNALTFTAGGMKQITELPALFRPHVTAGDGSTSLAGWLSMRGGNR